MTQYKPTSILLLAIAVALPATAATGRDAITTSQIADAISNVGMKTSADQIALLTTAVARTSSPVLKVRSIEPWDEHRMKVRLECSDNNECLPFYVGIRDESDIEPKPATIIPVMFRSPTLSARVRTKGEPFAVRSGSSAVLFLEGNHVHIEVGVICLENGAIGQTIRATSRDHRKTYRVEVFDGGILKGRL
jgi:hypothetical protein